jgi:hypothetical protein
LLLLLALLVLHRHSESVSRRHSESVLRHHPEFISCRHSESVSRRHSEFVSRRHSEFVLRRHSERSEEPLYFALAVVCSVSPTRSWPISTQSIYGENF